MIFRKPSRAVAGVWLAAIVWGSNALADTDDDGDDDFLPGRTQDQIDALFSNFDEVVETATLYTALAVTLAILLCLSAFLRLPRWATYVALTMLSMVWLAYVEQYSTNQFWIGVTPGEDMLIGLGFALASLHFLVAAASIRSGQRLAWARPVLLACGGLIWAVWWLAGPATLTGPTPAFYLVAAAACLSHLLAAPSFLSLQGTTSSVTRNGTVFAMVVTSGVLFAVLFGELSEEVDAVFLLRLCLVALTLFFVIFFARYVLALLFERDANARLALATARKEARTAQALLQAEQNYADARDAARLHRTRLAAASHDIRQPIASLRSTMDAIAGDQPPDIRAQLAAAFDYMDELARSYVGEGEEGADSATDSQGKPETIEAEVIANTLDRMFRKEAEERGLTFEVSAQPAQLFVRPLILTRVLSNLISNAIKHTPEGEVSVTGLCEPNGYRFSVANSAALPEGVDGEDLFAPYIKGETSEGTGLGLSIVERFSRQSGWILTWSSEAKTGAKLDILVPHQ